VPAAGAIDDQPAHDPRGVGHEAVAIGKRRTLAARDIEIGLVQERRRAARSPCSADVTSDETAGLTGVALPGVVHLDEPGHRTESTFFTVSTFDLVAGDSNALRDW